MTKTTPPRPVIYLLATGGTIAGCAANLTETLAYAAGAIGAEELLASVPAAAALATVRSETIAAIDSKDMTEHIWRTLADRTAAHLADPKTAGIVITHGTDTLEETAYFLQLTLRSPKPVVLTGAMRPATALSADGPANLLNAVRLAAAPQARGRGVLVTLHDAIFAAAAVTKLSALRLNAFAAPHGGEVGRMVGEAVHFFAPAPPAGPHLPCPKAPLPPVAILYGYAGDDGAMVRAAVAAKYQGIVYAGAGLGSLPQPVSAALAEAQRRGVIVLRSSRLPDGYCAPLSPDDGAPPFLTSSFLSPVKARLLLQLALAHETPPAALPALFQAAGAPAAVNAANAMPFA